MATVDQTHLPGHTALSAISAPILEMERECRPKREEGEKKGTSDEERVLLLEYFEKEEEEEEEDVLDQKD